MLSTVLSFPMYTNTCFHLILSHQSRKIVLLNIFKQFFCSVFCWVDQVDVSTCVSLTKKDCENGFGKWSIQAVCRECVSFRASSGSPL